MKKHQSVPRCRAHWQDIDSLSLSELKASADMVPKRATAINAQHPQHIGSLPPLSRFTFVFLSSHLSLSLSRSAWLTPEKRPSVQLQHTAHVPVRLFVVQLWGGGSPARKTSPPPFSSDNSPFCCVARDRLVCEIGLGWCQGTVWSWPTAAF